MTVTASETRLSYNGDGVATSFAFGYKFFKNADLIVYLVEIANPLNATLLTLDVNYTVTGAGLQVGGAVHFAVAPPIGFRVVIINDPPIIQDKDYVNADSFPAESHEEALDRLTKICQRVRDIISRTVRVPDTSDDPPPSVVTIQEFQTAAQAAAADAAAQAALANATLGTVNVVLGQVLAALAQVQGISGALLDPAPAAGAYIMRTANAAVPNGRVLLNSDFVTWTYDDGVAATISAVMAVAAAADLLALAADKKLLDTTGVRNALAYVAGGNVAGNFTPDFRTFFNTRYTLVGNAVMQFPVGLLANLIGRSGIIEFIQDGTGSRTLGYASTGAFGANTYVSDAAGIVLAAGAGQATTVGYHVRSAVNIELYMLGKALR